MFFCTFAVNTNEIMSNSDFWESINNIIRNGFTDADLLTLNTYAEHFIGRKLIYKRFSPQEQYGCSIGGVTNVIASLLAGADVATDKLDAPIGSVKREFQYAEAQANVIEQWAKAAHCWIDKADAKFSALFGPQIAEGGEAKIFYKNGNTVIKSIGLDYYIQPILALDRVSLHNTYFQETRLTVLGFGRNADGEFKIIVEQPFIIGSSLSDDKIQTFATNMGFTLKNPKNWTYATPEIYLSDLHDENVIVSNNGNVFIVDCDIRINTPELKQGGIRTLTTEVEY